MSARAKVSSCNFIFVKFYCLIQKCLRANLFPRAILSPHAILYAHANLTATHVKWLSTKCKKFKEKEKKQHFMKPN